VHLLRVRKQAKVEILEAFDRYFQNSPTAAQRFVVAVDEAIARIEEAPEQFPVIHGRLRRALLRRFPYAVYFKIYPSVISVVGVIHGHRHPDTWLLRS
jgi:plasmid stabilization system protein ParE